MPRRLVAFASVLVLLSGVGSETRAQSGLAELSVADAFTLRPEFAERIAETWSAPAARGSRFRFDVTGFADLVELDEVTQDLLAADFTTGASAILGEFDIEDVDRRRAGVRSRFGIEEISGQLSIWGERYEPFDEFRLIGFEMAAAGTPHVDRFGDVSLVFDYSVGISFAGGDGDVAFVDSTTGQVFEVDGDIAYVGEQIRFGAGVDVFGVIMTAGVIADYMQGTIDVDVHDNMDFDADNYGGFVSLAFAGDERVPLFARVQAYFGDVRGVAFELGVRF
jgi:hypothetical protein